jgi:hypothetical protein
MGLAPLLTVARVAPLGLSLSLTSGASTGVDLLGLLDDKSILHQLPDVLPCASEKEGAHRHPRQGEHSRAGAETGPPWEAEETTAS